MEKITQENFNRIYVDSIEQRQIDHFVCKEMGRQIHRYIKGMSGRKCIMEKFEEALSTLTVAEKEEAIARYIDLNRKSISGLDFKLCWRVPLPTIATPSTICSLSSTTATR